MSALLVGSPPSLLFWSPPMFAARFWAKVDKTASCWLWTGRRDSKGYGRVQTAAGRRRSSPAVAHRVAYELVRGPIPEALTLDHLCRVRLCVNPAHLEAVTLAENKRRGESVWAINARKTHCIHGHLFDEINTFYREDGRVCIACRRISRSKSTRKWNLKKRAELLQNPT